MKNSDDLHYFLGIEFIHQYSGIILSQPNYAIDLLTCDIMVESKSILTSCVVGHHWEHLGESLVDFTVFTPQLVHYNISLSLDYIYLAV